MRCIITVGISASGKSTWAKEYVRKAYVRTNNRFGVTEINRDTIRQELTEAKGKEWCWANWQWSREKEVTAIVDMNIAACVENGVEIIISDTNLNKARRENLADKLTLLGYTVEIKEFPVALEVAWARDAARKNGVGHSVIAKQYEEWLEYVGRKKYIADTSLPRCILVDIDGTLAHMNGKRGAFEWHNVGRDDVDEMVRDVVNSWQFVAGGEVIVLSGRDGVCREETFAWLKNNRIVFTKLIMRTPDDMRDDR